MIGEKETINLLDAFFEDCLKFWVKEGKDYEVAFELAVNEVSQATHNPFSPAGDFLDEDTKQKYISKINRVHKLQNDI